MSIWVKICGLTSVDDALFSAEAGADALGLNFVPSSKRRVTLEVAERIQRAVGSGVELVAVVASPTAEQLHELRERLGDIWLQLHGTEGPAELAALGPRAFKALAVSGAADVAKAREFGGDRLLVDAKVAGALGGTGRTFDWRLVQELARERPLIVAGGLTPQNVAEAVRQLAPFGVDVASGVESTPGRKDSELVRSFVRRARG